MARNEVAKQKTGDEHVLPGGYATTIQNDTRVQRRMFNSIIDQFGKEFSQDDGELLCTEYNMLRATHPLSVFFT